MAYSFTFRNSGHLNLNAIFNGILFNITWFAIVFTQSNLVAIGIVLFHLLIHFSVMGRGLSELRLVAGITFFGLLLDQLLFLSGVFTLDGQVQLAPLWLTCIWPVLGTTLMHAFRGLWGRYWFAALLGAIGGVASYSAGIRLSDVAFGDPVAGPVIMAVLWAIIFPSLLQAAKMNAEEKGEVS